MRLGAARALGNALTRTALKPRTSRNINTSSKKTSSTTAEAGSAKKKNWVTYGFDQTHEFIDRLSMHSSFFMGYSLCIIAGGLYWLHAPDPRLQEWAQREGYLELRRRERLGLLPIDPNYFDPATITLPTDEELGDTPIII